MTKWTTGYRCVGCKHSMSYNTRMGSHGRCPYCGFKHPDACTIVECVEHAYRYVKVSGWGPWAKYEREELE